MGRGTIRRLVKDRGYGFIQGKEGEDLFFHRSQLQGVDYDSLGEGQEVEFEIQRLPDGRHRAVKVRLAQAQAPHDESPTSQ
jgi:CspA family cold shock protein